MTIAALEDSNELTHPMDNSSRVKMFNATQHLIEEVRHSFMVKFHLNHLAKICIHELHHYVTVKANQKEKLGDSSSIDHPINYAPIT